MKLNQENLIKSGYVTYKNFLHRDNKLHLESYQKYIEDNNGKKYNIIIDCYSFRTAMPNMQDEYFKITVQFTDKNCTFDVSRVADMDMINIEDIEQFYEDIWFRFNCLYCEKY